MERETDNTGNKGWRQRESEVWTEEGRSLVGVVLLGEEGDARKWDLVEGDVPLKHVLPLAPSYSM